MWAATRTAQRATHSTCAQGTRLSRCSSTSDPGLGSSSDIGHARRGAQLPKQGRRRLGRARLPLSRIGWQFWRFGEGACPRRAEIPSPYLPSRDRRFLKRCLRELWARSTIRAARRHRLQEGRRQGRSLRTRTPPVGGEPGQSVGGEDAGVAGVLRPRRRSRLSSPLPADRRRRSACKLWPRGRGHPPARAGNHRRQGLRTPGPPSSRETPRIRCPRKRVKVSVLAGRCRRAW